MKEYRVKVRRTATIVLEYEFPHEFAETPEQAAAAALDVAETSWPWSDGWYEPDGYGMNMEWHGKQKVVSVEEVE